MHPDPAANTMALNLVNIFPEFFLQVVSKHEENPQEQIVIHVVNDLYKETPRLVDVCTLLRQANIMARNGRNFTPQQVKRLITGYQNSFAKVHGKLGRHIRRFIEAVA